MCEHHDGGATFLSFLLITLAAFPFWEHIIRHENYCMERACLLRRKASGGEGAAPSLENIGQRCQLEFDGRCAFCRPQRKNSEWRTREVRNRWGQLSDDSR